MTRICVIEFIATVRMTKDFTVTACMALISVMHKLHINATINSFLILIDTFWRCRRRVLQCYLAPPQLFLGVDLISKLFMDVELLAKINKYLAM